MSALTDKDQYSTLEVATDADVIRQGRYPEVVAPSVPETYGYYAPAKAEQAVQNPQNAQLPLPLAIPATQPQLPSTAQSYSTYPEVVDANPNANAAAGADGPRICGVRRKYFWIGLVVAVLVVVGVVVGAVVGSMKHGTTSSSSSPSADQGDQNPNSDSSGGNSSGNNSTGSTKLALYEDTQLASANFTDAYGNDNFLLVYQLSDASICMSAFNSSNNKWVVSTIVNGTDGIKLGASLAIDTFWQGTNSPDVNLYYQGNGSAATLKSLAYSSSSALSTTSVTPSSNWTDVEAASGFNSLPGSSLVAYGKQCEFCNQYAYFFWQGQQGLFMAQISGDAIQDANLIDVSVEPSTNSSLALTYSGTLNGDSAAILRRSINIFYRSTTSGLTQLRIGNGMNVPSYVGRDIGPRTSFAAFSTGFNESDADENPTPLGFQVLSIDPDVDDGVQLTYLKDGDWTAVTDEVEDLASCKAKATIAVNTGRRLYCLVDSDDGAGVEIIEWAWQGDPSDTDTYLDWEKIGAVSVGV
ncbi:hypothetical protein ONZ43_g6723 [Nemania bipapillata]|uniref:Uncharacterized protein n=1 Tax=Nemania bipapillata TaxID=110536 RepID=A0ACC2HWN0_9PEZI|nr:hypothetical protein ONZ43_g6723 [Nemania bipapillata]